MPQDEQACTLEDIAEDGASDTVAEEPEKPVAETKSAAPEETTTVAAVSEEAARQSATELLEQERQAEARQRRAERRQKAREEQAQWRIHKMLRIQKVWDQAALGRDRAANAETGKQKQKPAVRIPAGKPESVAPQPAEPSDTETNVATAPVASKTMSYVVTQS